MFVKLINERVITTAPKNVLIGDTTIVNPTEEQYEEAGYYELEETAKPESKKWYNTVAKYELIENKIHQSWEYTKKEKPEYSELIVGYIREVYSIDDELALQRQCNNSEEKKQEFDEYNSFCDNCKLKAKADISEWENA